MLLSNNTDFKLDEDKEDLAVDPFGRLAMVDNTETILSAVIRRSVTAPDGYARMVRVGASTDIYDSGYFTDLPYMLSSSDLSYVEVNNAFNRAANGDGRLSIAQADISMVEQGKYQVDLIYTLADGSVDSFNTLL